MPKNRAQWSEDQLQRAMLEIQAGMSVRRAAMEFNIPRRTLRNHMKSGSNEKKIGRPSYLTSEQESELCQRIFRLGDVGMPLTSKVIRRSVFSYCENNALRNPFNVRNGLAGRKWLKLFLKRNPQVARRKSQSMNAARAAKLNRFIVKDYFQKLLQVMTDLDVMQKPHLIFNIDEKGCRLTLHKSQQVYVRKGQKRVHLISQEHAENVSIVACVSAVGQVIPPMILFKGKRKKAEWEDNLPPGTQIEMTEKGSMTTPVFVKWLAHFAHYKPPGPVLLIFDGASSHLDATILSEADKHEITLFCLPSNTTHELQPLDKSVFKPFESYWDDEVMLFWTNKPDRTINKFTFGTIFSKVWPKAVTADNVIAGFRATGIYPYDPNIIPDCAYAPSEITMHQIEVEHREDPADEPIATSTPKTHKNIKKHRTRKDVSEDSFSSSEAESVFSLHDESDEGTNRDEPLPEVPEEEPDLSCSFKDILVTPEVKTKQTGRKKSINYRAQQITRNLFTEVQEKPKEKAVAKQTEVRSKAGPSGIHSKKKESWYCHLCCVDEVSDMRLCVTCQRYVHESCVGLTASDKVERFVCPSCGDSD